jgi:3-oxoacyl-[acyl-carrier protein] reductase
MSRLTGKVAIVTGASKGIGAGIAEALGVEGAAVVVNYASSREGADRVVESIRSQGGKAIAVQADVAKPGDVRRLFEAAQREFGSLDILVNNAGIYQFAPLAEVTEDEYRRQFDINVLGTILTLQESLKHFGPQGGSVINVSSVASLNATPNTVVYSATKAAVDSITRTLSHELSARKIRVNTLAPGATETEGLHSAGIKGSDFEKQMVSLTPLGRLGQPGDIARVAVFLASEESSWLTGERISASGGWH